MKNNKNVKILCAVVVMVLLTTCVIGTTLARYVTSDSASDTARVAKWGIELAVGGTLFGSDYAENSTAADANQIVAEGSHSVSALDGQNIVAPGTKNDTGFAFTLSGTPEVEYDVIATTSGNEDIYLNAGSYGMMVECYGLNAASNVVGLYTENAGVYTAVPADGVWTDGVVYYELRDVCELTEAYYPLTWTVTGNNIAGIAGSHKNINTLASTLATAVSDQLDGEAEDNSEASFTLTWAWAFGGNDAADTILGNLMANTGNIVVKSAGTYQTISVDVANNKASLNGATVANLDVTFNFAVTVQQVD